MAFEVLDQNLLHGMIKMVVASNDKGRVLLAEIYTRRTACLAASVLLPGRVVVKMFLDHSG